MHFQNLVKNRQVIVMKYPVKKILQVKEELANLPPRPYRCEGSRHARRGTGSHGGHACRTAQERLRDDDDPNTAARTGRSNIPINASTSFATYQAATGARQASSSNGLEIACSHSAREARLCYTNIAAGLHINGRWIRDTRRHPGHLMSKQPSLAQH
jgi:hypothetical protein